MLWGRGLDYFFGYGCVGSFCVGGVLVGGWWFLCVWNFFGWGDWIVVCVSGCVVCGFGCVILWKFVYDCKLCFVIFVWIFWYVVGVDDVWFVVVWGFVGM